MSNVKKHMDKLFAKYPQTNETLELKEEVIGNVEAEIADLQSRGHSFEEAFRISRGKMAKLDELIEGLKSIRISKVIFEMMQWALIYTLIAWILITPLSIFYSFRRASWILFLIVIMIGISYLIFYMIRRLLPGNYMQVNLYNIARLRKIVWIIWFIFITAKWGMTTATLFGSNIWFWRPISINGPYEFASVGVLYAAPLITVIVPLLLNKLEKVIVIQGEVHLDEK